jgi:hypothetical protein
MGTPHRIARCLFVLALCLPLLSCFEDPVTEHIHLRIFGSGHAIVTIVHGIAPSERAGDNLELSDRLEASRDTLEQRLDPWSRRLQYLQPLAETTRLERIDGELRRAVHSVALNDFSEAVELLEVDGLTGSLSVTGSAIELQLLSTGSTRATAIQAQEVERLIEQWSADVADYLGAVIRLYAYLDLRPERAVPCFAHVFEVHDDDHGPLAPEEERLVKDVKRSMEAVAEALQVEDATAFSLNELSRLVYDPFPARLTVVVDGDVLANRGFETVGGAFERPQVDAWNAFRALEGRWLAPDVVTAAVSPAPEDQQPEPEPARFAAVPRWHGAAPSPDEVAAALIDNLRPEDELVLQWRPSPAAGDDRLDRDWIAAIAAAEAGLAD